MPVHVPNARRHSIAVQPIGICTHMLAIPCPGNVLLVIVPQRWEAVRNGQVQMTRSCHGPSRAHWSCVQLHSVCGVPQRLQWLPRAFCNEHAMPQNSQASEQDSADCGHSPKSDTVSVVLEAHVRT